MNWLEREICPICLRRGPTVKHMAQCGGTSEEDEMAAFLNAPEVSP